MKPGFLTYRFTIIAAAIYGCIAFTQEIESAKILFHRGLHLEEVKGELGPAITVYQQVLEEFAAERPIAAKAQLHIGICHEKLGKEKAVKAYKRVLEEYGNQHEVVAEARKRLEWLKTKMSQVKPKAREAYIKADYHQNMYRGISKSAEYYEQAIAIDSTFAAAYVGLATLYVFGGALRMPPREAMPIAEKNVLKALDIDPNLSDAHTVYGMIKMYYHWDWKGAEKEFKRAIELNNDDVNAHEQFALLLASMKRMDESIIEINKALSIDPVNRWANPSLGMLYFFNHDYDRALEQYRKTIELQPHRAVLHVYLYSVFWQKQMYPEAMRSLQEYFLIGGDSTLAGIVGTTFAESGYEIALRKWAEAWEPFTEHGGVQASSIALIYASIEEKDKALEWLQKGYEMHSRDMMFIGVQPRFDSLRSDDRFIELMEKMGLPQ